MLRVAVDFGTSSTCAAVSVDGRAPQIVVVDGAPLIPSAVYATGDGTLFVGHEADRQAAVDPSRYEPHPKRRIDEPELLLGDTVLPVVGVVRAVLRRALLEARHLAGGAGADQLVLTHPADWGAARTQKLRRSAHGLAAELVLVPEPVAAAVFHAQGHAVPEGGCLAVLDLGGGTVDASVVRRVGAGFRVLATRGDPHFGGADVDQALLEHVGAQVSSADADGWRALVEGRELADRRRRRVLRQDIRGAKETLSRHAYADVPMPPPFPDAHVTRADLEGLIAAPMLRTIALLTDTIVDAGLRPEQLVGVFLVGGSSRIPMVSRLLHERLGVVPVTLDQPETVVARGALHAVLADAARPPGAPRPSLLAPPAPSGFGSLGPTPPGHGSAGHGSAGHGPATPGLTPSGLAPSGSSPSGPGGSGHALLGPGPPAAPGSRSQGAPGNPSPRSPGGQPQGPGGTPAAGRSAFFPTQPPPRRAGKSRTPWLVGGAVLAVVALGATLAFVLFRPQAPQQVAEQHYRFTVPDGWQRTGGNEAVRQVNLGPLDSSLRPDRIIVKEVELSYDASSDADRARAVDELRADYEQRRAATDPPSFDGFDETASFAGRDVLYYSEVVSAGTVDWYVVFGGRFQVSVGCQHDEVGAERVRTACARVLGTLTVETQGS